MTGRGPKFELRVRLSFAREDGLWYADCESLQGCHTFGESKEDAIERITDIISDRLLAGVREAGDVAKRRVAERTRPGSVRPATARFDVAIS